MESAREHLLAAIIYLPSSYSRLVARIPPEHPVLTATAQAPVVEGGSWTVLGPFSPIWVVETKVN